MIPSSSHRSMPSPSRWGACGRNPQPPSRTLQPASVFSVTRFLRLSDLKPAGPNRLVALLRFALTVPFGRAVFRLGIAGTIFGLIVDMIAALFPVLVPTALVEPAAMREDSSGKKHHKNENPKL